MNKVTLEEVQRAFAACLAAHPIVDQVLPKESGPLAELLGIMAYERTDTLDTQSVRPACMEAISRWSAARPE